MRRIILGVFLLCLLMQTVTAQDVQEGDVLNVETGMDVITNETKNEIRTMFVPEGIRLRFLQLERAMNKNILVGWDLISIIQEFNSTANITELEALIKELNLTLQQLESFGPEGMNVSEVVQFYVGIKNDAVSLTNQFRQMARNYLAGYPDLQDLKNRLLAQDRTEIARITQRIMQERREFNAVSVRRFVNRMGVSSEDLVSSIRDGELSADQVKQRIRSNFASLNVTQKIRVIQNVTAERIERSSNVSVRVLEARNNFFNKTKERLNNRLEIANQSVDGNLTSVVRNRIESRIQNVDNLQQSVNVRITNRIQRLGSLSNRIGGAQ